MGFDLPSNFLSDPEEIIRRQRQRPATIESPAAPPPPRFNWRPEALDSPDAGYTILATPKTQLPDPNDETLPKDARIVREFFNSQLESTPRPPGSFIFTPQPTNTMDIGSGSGSKGKEREVEEDASKDALIARLQAEVATLQADRSRIIALEASMSKLLANQDVTARGSGGSMETAGTHLAYPRFNNAETPTPLAPRNIMSDAQGTPQLQVPPTSVHNSGESAALTHNSGRQTDLLSDDIEDPPPITPTVNIPTHTAFVPESQPETTRRVSFLGGATPVTNVPATPFFTLASTDKAIRACDIKLADVPKFTGPIENPTALFNWRRLIEQFFKLKRLDDVQERLMILGSVVVEPRAGNWLRSMESELNEMAWKEIMHAMAVETLPTGWLYDTEKALRQLKIKPQEDFKTFANRARDLYSLIEVETTITVKGLAEYVVWGAPDVFQRWVTDRGLLKVERFKWLEFIAAASDIWALLLASNLIPKVTTNQAALSNQLGNTRSYNQPRVSTWTNDRRTADERADSAWHYHQYLRHLGICAACRTKCGNPQCQGPIKGPYIVLPPLSVFDPGPRPPRRANAASTNTTTSGRTGGSAGTPTQKPAGRPAAPLPVRAIEQIDPSSTTPDLFDTEIQRYEEADRILIAHMEEETTGRSQPNVGNNSKASKDTS